jgi:menaquinol-cytochrome c reductase cytochrome b/c subunit
VNRQEKEVYLREYSILKAQGKPFWPYAVAKDGAMACVVLLAIIVLSIVLGAELGPKADPTTTTYTPRPEWYFFFLFELLRVIKPPALVSLATLGIPTICMIMLFLLPFYDRGPERRPAPRRRSSRPRRTGSRPKAERCCASTRPANRSWRSPGAWPATRSARTATAGPART